jgi:hypothetical protein
LHERPVYQPACERIRMALRDVERAIEVLREAHDQAQVDLTVKLPRVAPIEPQLSGLKSTPSLPAKEISSRQRAG